MTGRLVRNTLLGSASGAATTLATFGCGVAVARLLGPEAGGAVAYVLWCTAVAVSLSDLGIGMVLQRFVPELEARGREDEARRLIGSLAAARMISTAAGAGIVLLWLTNRGDVAGSSASADWSDPWLVALLLFAVVVQSMSSLYAAYLKGRQRFDTLARLVSIGAALQIAGVILGAWIAGVVGALAGYVLPAMLLAIPSLRLVRLNSISSTAITRPIVRFAVASWLAGVVGGLVWGRSEIFFLEAFASAREVGLFAAAAMLTGVATAVPTLLTSALLPFFSEQHGREERGRMQSVYSGAIGISALLVLPACFGLAAIAPVLVPLLLGQEFAEAVAPTIVLLLAAAIGVLGSANAPIIYGVGKSRILLDSNLAGLIAMVLLSVIMIPRWGMLGAAWTRVIVQLGVVVIETWYVSGRLRFAVPWAALGKLALAAGLAGAGAHLAVALVGGPVSLVLAIPAGLALFLLAIRAFDMAGGVDPELLRLAVSAAPPPARAPIAGILSFLSPGDAVRTPHD